MNSTSSSHYLNNYPAVVSFDEYDSDYEYNEKELYSSSDLYAADDDNASSNNNVSTATEVLLLDEVQLDVLVNRDATAAAAAENATTTATTTATFTTDDNNISIDVSDIVNKYDEDDLNLMREGLSLVIDDDEVIMADSNNNNNSVSVSPTTDYDYFDDRINDMFDTTEKYRAATTTRTTTTTIGHYPSLLAQVTFDEDEDGDSSSLSSPSHSHSHQQVERYDENDLNLMREALIVIDDGDDDAGIILDSGNNNISPIDYNFFFDDHINNNSSASKTADKYRATTTAKTTTLFGSYSTLLAHVTFDEDEDDNDNSLPRSRSQHQVEPSPWLNGQLSSYYDATTPFPRSSRGRTSSRRSTKNNKRRTNNNAANEATRHQHWSDQEDERLKIEVQKQKFQGGNINWEVISKSFGCTRAPIQCKNRLNNYLQSGKVYGDWDQYEDECILDMKREGFMWADISDRLQRRTGNHIRERFVNYLDPNIKKTPWTKEDDKILLTNQRILGNKWADIQKLLPGPGVRPQNSIKNRFNNRVQANKRRLARSQKQQNVFRLN
jgi:hypothetical protein